MDGRASSGQAATLFGEVSFARGIRRQKDSEVAVAAAGRASCAGIEAG
jgi:hypothetical protein